MNEYKKLIRLCFLDSIINYFEREFIREDPDAPLFSINDVISILNSMQSIDMMVMFTDPKEMN